MQRSSASRPSLNLYSRSILTLAAMLATAHAHADAFRIEPAAGDPAVLGSLVPQSAHEAQPESAAPAPTEHDAVWSFGEANTSAFEVSIAAASDFNDVTLGILDAGVQWFVADEISVGLFAEAIYASQNPENALGGGGGVLLRWHFVREERFTLFVDLGCGLLATDNELPSGGTELNFTPRADFGATFALDARTHLIARLGWFHVSNAQTGEGNPGIDAASVGLGISFGF